MKIQDAIEAFHRNWDEFPGPARLIRKDRTILAANKYAEKAGFLVDVQCSKVGPPESHKGCLANKTMMNKMGHGDIVANKMARYWLPVDGFDDIFVHLSVRVQDIIERK